LRWKTGVHALLADGGGKTLDSRDIRAITEPRGDQPLFIGGDMDSDPYRPDRKSFRA
jgi:hypothetical protein